VQIASLKLTQRVLTKCFWYGLRYVYIYSIQVVDNIKLNGSSKLHSRRVRIQSMKLIRENMFSHRIPCYHTTLHAGTNKLDSYHEPWIFNRKHVFFAMIKKVRVNCVPTCETLKSNWHYNLFEGLLTESYCLLENGLMRIFFLLILEREKNVNNFHPLSYGGLFHL
jgi:hypothetical protein